MQLLWFRQDLRLNDHVALWHATQQGQTAALVILSPEQWALHADADIKIDFKLSSKPSKQGVTLPQMKQGELNCKYKGSYRIYFYTWGKSVNTINLLRPKAKLKTLL